MRAKTKAWLILATILVLMGAVLFAGVMSFLKWDFRNLAPLSYRTVTHEIQEPFDSISVNTNTANVIFALADDQKCKVTCYETDKESHSVNVKDGVLTITQEDQRSLYDYIGFYNESQQITIYLPETKYETLLLQGNTFDMEVPTGFLFQNAELILSTGDVYFGASVLDTLRIQGSTADIVAENMTAGFMDLSVSTGDITLTNITGTDLAATMSTGDISLHNVIAAQSFRIETSTGDVKFTDCDAADIQIKTRTGDVSGNFLTNKVFVTEVSTGDVNVPNTTTGGICRIQTGTGDIHLEIS